MKQRIRLTEEDLNRIIENSVRKVINERVRGEKGMSDDEVRRRRNDNYCDDRDCNFKYNHLLSNPWEPTYSDRMEMYGLGQDDDPNEYVERDRLAFHRRNQNIGRGRKKYGDDFEMFDY